MDRRRVLERLDPAHQGQAYSVPAEELQALVQGHIFCLVSGNLDIAGMAGAFLSAMPKIERAFRQDRIGFWHVYRDGSIARMWP